MLRRLSVAAFASFVVAAVASCGGILPNSAVPGHIANGYYPIDDTTPLVALIRERGIESPSRSSPTPLLEQLAAEVAKSDIDGRYKGITYDLTRGNSLARDWIVQSPNLWGRKANEFKFYPLDCPDCGNSLSLPICDSDADCNGGTCTAIWPRPDDRRGARRKVCLGQSDELAVRLHDLVVRAQRRVDISMLEPPADARFFGALKDALQTLALSGRAVTVRIVVGQHPPHDVDAAALLKSLVSGIEQLPRSRMRVSVAAMRSCIGWEECNSYSWNHSKIVSVDGIDAQVGGHNLWSRDYLINEPVHDLSMRVRGPAAANAARFTDRLWEYVCGTLDKAPKIVVASFPFDGSVPEQTCLTPPPLQPARSAGGVPILGVGRLGAGITKDFANQSELARDLMFGSAQKSVRIMQQDLGFTLGRADKLYPESSLARLVTLLLERQGDVYIVLSNEGAVGNSGSSYSNDVSLKELARHIRELVQKRIDDADPKARYSVRAGPDPVNALLCEHVFLAPLRFGPDRKWPSGAAIVSHAKFWMVDDRTFYIGSDNMYPVNLQEFGYIVDDAKAAGEILDAWWTPLWQWSQRAAVSGRGVDKCIFRELLK